jgi:2'-5' RNA ligase
VELANDEVAHFRRRFDSLYGKCPPHVTLAFPFVSDPADREIARSLEASRPPVALDVALLAPQFEGGYVLLPVDQPDPWFGSIHLVLSSLVGVRSTQAYRPHVTVGRSLKSAPVSAMAALPRRQQGRFDRVVIEEIQEDESSRVIHEIGFND